MTTDQSRPGRGAGTGSAAIPPGAVLRRTEHGWSVGDEIEPDLTSAMVLADLLAADLPEENEAAAPDGQASPPAPAADGARTAKPAAAERAAEDEASRLRLTVGQLERALSVRVRVEQAIGILSERHRIRPRQAFEQLRAVARARGQRVIDIAGDVIASATNPLLPLPDELSRPSVAARQRVKSQRRLRNEG
jgi:hypothetical protein